MVGRCLDNCLPSPRLVLVLELGRPTRQLPPRKIVPRLGLGLGLGLVLGLGGGAIFHGGNCPGTVKAYLQRFPFCRHFILFCYRNSHRCCSIKKTFLKYFAIITRKHLFWGLFLITLQAFSPATLSKTNSNTAALL